MTGVRRIVSGVDEDRFTHTQIAQKIIEMGMAKSFIAIGIGMVSDLECDLDGHVSRYACDMERIAKKAILTMIEEEEE